MNAGLSEGKPSDRWVLEPSPEITMKSQPPFPQNVTLFGNSLESVIELRCVLTGLE